MSRRRGPETVISNMFAMLVIGLPYDTSNRNNIVDTEERLYAGSVRQTDCNHQRQWSEQKRAAEHYLRAMIIRADLGPELKGGCVCLCHRSASFVDYVRCKAVVPGSQYPVGKLFPG